MKVNLFLIMLFSLAMFVGPGCGDDESDDSSNGDGGAGEIDTSNDDTGADSDTNDNGEAAGVKETITAAEGGTVELEDGSASLAIPAGALAEDTEISIDPINKGDLVDAANLGSNGIELGPDGTQFSSPVALTLALEGEVPEGKEAVIAVLNGTEWETIEGSSAADGSVTADITHFSTYVIRFVDGNIVVTTPECETLDFTPCGGDVVGRWVLQDMCMEAVIGENPYATVSECQTMVYTVNVDYSQTLELKADGTLTIEIGATSYAFHYEIEEACLKAISPSMTQAEFQEVCTEFADEDDTCAITADKCICDTVPETSGESQTIDGTYTVDGTTITTTTQGDTGPDTTTGGYCVNGNTLVSEGSKDEVTYKSIFEKE